MDPRNTPPMKTNAETERERELNTAKIRPMENGWAVRTNGVWAVYTNWELLVGDLGRHFVKHRELARAAAKGHAQGAQ
jgi:hypothetical protein